MLVGALFWGLGADIIGRRFAFNVSLFICSTFAILAGAAPNWPCLGFFIAMTGFGGGGNLILDTTVFLEYLPSNKQWVLTWLASWWGLGGTIAGLIAWPLMCKSQPTPNTKQLQLTYLAADPLNCTSAEDCTYANNKGWRYLMYTCGALVFIMSILRVTVIRLRETPKYLLGMGKDAELLADFQAMAATYKRPCSLTLEQLESCGTISLGAAHGKSKFDISEYTVHFRGLFANLKIGLSTVLIWISWTLIGLAYPLFYVFLSSYLATRGARFGTTSNYITWRNYALANVSGIFGPMLAGHMANYKYLGRKYTMVIGALVTSKSSRLQDDPRLGDQVVDWHPKWRSFSATRRSKTKFRISSSAVSLVSV